MVGTIEVVIWPCECRADSPIACETCARDSLGTGTEGMIK